MMAHSRAARRAGTAALLLALTIAGLFSLPLASTLWPRAQAEELVAEPDGYRMGDFRSFVPETVQGGRAITTEEAKAIHAAGNAVFVDVLPQNPRPPNLPAATISSPIV